MGIRPDGHGIWTSIVSGGQLCRLPFFLEYDAGSEPVSELANRIGTYNWFVTLGGPPWPALVWLSNAVREEELRQLRTVGSQSPGRRRIPIATASREYATSLGLSPAGAVWQLQGYDTPRLSLDEIATTLDLPDPYDVVHHSDG